MKLKNLEDCLTPVQEAEVAKKWATACKVFGVILVFAITIAGILIWANTSEAGLGLIIIAAGIIIGSTFLILGSILDALGVTAQSVTETARMTYFNLNVNKDTNVQKTKMADQIKSKPMANKLAHTDKVPSILDNAPPPKAAKWTIIQDEGCPTSTGTPTIDWECPCCGWLNQSHTNVCTNCNSVITAIKR